MTDFFRFDELTFPEVAALPREAALILPVGLGYDQQNLASALGNPDRIGVFPALPFGWVGSGLETPKPVFSAMVRNLIGNMIEDGFTNVRAVVGGDGWVESDIPQVVVEPSLQPAMIPPSSGANDGHGTWCPPSAACLQPLIPRRAQTSSG